MNCEFALTHRSCDKPATHVRRVTVKSIFKGAAHQFNPPDAFYCDQHADLVRKWNNGSNPQIMSDVTKISHRA